MWDGARQAWVWQRGVAGGSLARNHWILRAHFFFAKKNSETKLDLADGLPMMVSARISACIAMAA